jgi:cell division protease FtsH
MPSSQDWFPVKEKEKHPEGGKERKAEGPKRPANRNPPSGQTGNRFLIWYLLGMGGLMLAVHSLTPRARDGMIPYSAFKEKVRSREITKVEIGPNLIVGMPKPKGADPKSLAKAAPIRAVVPEEDASLIPMLDSLKVEYSARPEEGKGFLSMLLTWVFPALFFLGIWSFISKRAGGAAGAGLFSLGKSRAQVVEEGEVSTTFEDAAGVDEAK